MPKIKTQLNLSSSAPPSASIAPPVNITPPEDVSESDNEQIEKPKKIHVMTEARKQALEKAKLKKAENFAIRQAEKKKLEDEYQKILDAKKAKKEAKEAKKKLMELKKYETDSDSEESVIIKKKKKVNKKKVVYVSDDDEPKDDKKVVIINKYESKPEPIHPPIQPQKPKRLAVFL